MLPMFMQLTANHATA